MSVDTNEELEQREDTPEAIDPTVEPMISDSVVDWLKNTRLEKYNSVLRENDYDNTSFLIGLKMIKKNVNEIEKDAKKLSTLVDGYKVKIAKLEQNIRVINSENHFLKRENVYVTEKVEGYIKEKADHSKLSRWQKCFMSFR